MNLKEFIRRHQKESAIVGAVIVIFFVLYFIFFFSVGMRYDETFFTKSLSGGTAHYLGVTDRGKTDISVSAPKDGVTTVNYQLQDNSKKIYLVTLDTSIYDYNTNYPVHITNENGKVLYDGNLLRGHLFNKNGEPVVDDSTSDTLTANEVTRIALYQYDTIRGNPDALVFALLLFLVTILHWMFPLAIFSMLRHMIGVEDPQPSDRYLAVQKVIWSIIPYVGFALLINAILV